MAPLGKRLLPDGYIRTLNKPDNLTWEEFSKVARRKFEENQISEIEKLNETKCLEKNSYAES